MKVGTAPKCRPTVSPSSKASLTVAFVVAMVSACGGGEPSPGDTASADVASATSSPVVEPICFYGDTNYGGGSFCASANAASIGSWNDKISSVRVRSGYKVQLFQDTNYGGTSLTLSADAPNFVTLNFNDKVSSFKITLPPPSPLPPASQAQVASIQLAQPMLLNADDKDLLLVAAKAALLKVNVTTAKSGFSGPAGTVHVDNVNGGESRDLLLTVPTAQIPTSAPQVPSLDDSYTTLIPAEMVKPGLRLGVRVGDAAVNNVNPRVGGGVPIKFVPISIRIAGVAGQLPPDQSAHIRALFPVSDVKIQAHPMYTSTRVTVLPTTEAAWSNAFSKVLGELADLHKVEGAGVHDHYFGFAPKRTWGLVGIAYMRDSVGLAFDLPSEPTSVRDVVTHELGHNFSLPHAPCGGPADPDKNFPYPDAALGKSGHYVWSFLADFQGFYDPRPTNRHDVMSYCPALAFSDYNYSKMRAYLVASVPASTPSPSASAARITASAESTGTSEVLLVSGELTAAAAEFNPVKSLSSALSVSEGGPYTLHVVTATGSHDYPFTPHELDHNSALKHFGLTIPNTGAILSLSVLREGRTLGQIQAPPKVSGGMSRALGGASDKPTIQVHDSNGVVQLTWDANRTPFVTVTWVGGGQRVTLAQDLGGGSATLSSTDLPTGGSFELILSDGLNSTRQLVAR